LIILALWWGPILLAFMLLTSWNGMEQLDGAVIFVVYSIVLLGWSSFIMKYVVHRRIEPFFQIRSLQNRIVAQLEVPVRAGTDPRHRKP
jgi:hypothetical protein